MGAAFSGVTLLLGAWWYKDALIKFIVIGLIVALICYIIVLSLKMEERSWPPVFIGGALVTIGLWFIPVNDISMPNLGLDNWERAPHYENNPFAEEGGKRTKQSKKRRAR